MTFLRIVSTIALSVSLGIVIWLAISGLLYVVLDDWGGWPPLSPGTTSEHVIGGLIVGALHGLLVSLGLVVMLHRGSSIASLIASIAATEAGLVLAQTFYFTFIDTNWKPPTLIEAVQSSLVLFFFLSAALFVPTVLITLVVAYVVDPTH